MKSLLKKKALLSELLAAVRRQADAIASRDLEGLRDSIAARQAVMDRIDELDGRIHEGSRLSALSGDAGTEALQADIRALLQDIRDRDNENVKNADALVSSLMTGIRETNAERNLLAYSSAPKAGSRYVNKKG